jgi:plasmid maintenance system antidote protein VapI
METKIGQDVLSRFVREERGLSLETAGRLAVHLGYSLKRS